MENVLSWAGFGVAAAGSFAVALAAAKMCLHGLFRALTAGR